MAIGVLALTIAASALGANVAAATEGPCANERQREESRVSPGTGKPYSVGLPECRAYEMVSPLEKQTHDAGIKSGGITQIYQPGWLAVAPSGGATMWTSQSAFANPNSFGLVPQPEQPYLSRRTESGWITANSMVPQNVLLFAFGGGGAFADFSEDLTSHQSSCGVNSTTGVTQSQTALTLGTVTCAKRDGDGPWEATPSFELKGRFLLGEGGDAYTASSSDLSRVFLQLERPLLDGDYVPNSDTSGKAGGTAGIYELGPMGPDARLRLVNVGHEGAAPHLLVRRPEGLTEETVEAHTQAPLLGSEAPKNERFVGTQYHAVSESGKTVFFGATPEDVGQEPGRNHTEKSITALYARIPCSNDFPDVDVPCETEAEGQSVEGRQTIKVSDPNEAEGCALCASPTDVGNATTTASSSTVNIPSGGSSGVKAGMAVSGPGIPAATTVSSVSAGAGTITLSKPATATASGVLLTFSPLVSSVTTTAGSQTVSVPSGGFPGVNAGMVVTGLHIPGGTQVSSVSGNSLILSKAAEATASVTLKFTTELASAVFQGASADGSKVFFTTTQDVLVPEGAKATKTTSLYEYDFNRSPGDKLIDLTPDRSGPGPEHALGPAVVGLVRSSSDGSHLYFIANGEPLAGTQESERPVVGENEHGEQEHSEPGPEGGPRQQENCLYGVDTNTGTLRFIARTKGLSVAIGELSDPHAQATLDGRDLVFDSTSRLAGDTNPPIVNYLELSNHGMTNASDVPLTFSTKVEQVETVNGEAQISVPAGGFPKVVQGMSVSGSGIAPQTTVSSLAGNSLTLSSPAEATSPGATLTFATTVEHVSVFGGGSQTSVPAGGFPKVSAGMNVSGPGIPVGTTVKPFVDPEVVYRYDFQTGELTWISQPSPERKAEHRGSDEGLDAWVAATPEIVEGAFADYNDFSRAVTGEADGKHDGEDIIFSTQERLQPADAGVGKVAQLYLWHCASPCPHPNGEGVVRMISDGQGNVEAQAAAPEVVTEGRGPGASAGAAISASGTDIFFTTRSALVAQDNDELIDVYDARVGGGYPAPPPAAGCSGEACQAPPSPPSLGSFGPAPSSQLAAGGNLGAPSGGSLAFRTATTSLTTAQKLHAALKACKGRAKRKRAACEAQARRKYASKAKVKPKVKKNSRRAK